ncbi:hypothetical protein [Umezawaea sp. Da 62-37]|uniref:hypothetical protein n=1 Tax=Umezawaea sp. Da 62-37 TaxID=3075927 RepID=UPI0028F741D7|nr:hypothetical protein [Umezawaea sp. Da 62-37]WNV83707.1 hypothetical protein RM788_36825 [Umezawaea sp. Da 62-37]
MTPAASQPAGKERAWRYSRVGSIVASPDFYVGVPVGVACGLIPAFSLAAAAATQTVLLGVSAVAGALVALVLTAVTVLVAVITPTFAKMLDKTPSGLAGILRPYHWVMRISAASCGLGVISALAWPAMQAIGILRFVGTSIPIALLLWGLGGCLQIINLTGKTINQSRRIEQIDERSRALKTAQN